MYAEIVFTVPLEYFCAANVPEMKIWFPHLHGLWLVGMGKVLRCVCVTSG